MTDQPTSSSLYSSVEDDPKPPVKSAGRLEDFIDIFYTPSTVFKRRENSGFGIPLLVVTLTIGVLYLVNSNAMASIMDAEFSRGMASAMKKNPQLTPEMMEKMRSVGTTTAKIGAFIFLPIVIFLAGLFFWLVGKLFGAKAAFSQILMVTAYSYVPKIVEAVITSIQALLMDTSTLTGRYQLSLGVGRFLDPETASPVLLAFAGRIDVFTIWVTVLMAIGLSVVGKISRQKAALAAVVMYFLAAAFQVGMAARQ